MSLDNEQRRLFILLATVKILKIRKVFGLSRNIVKKKGGGSPAPPLTLTQMKQS